MFLKLFYSIFVVSLFVSCKETNENLIDKAYQFSKQKKYDEAIKIYSAVIKNNNKLQLPLYNRGLIYFKLEKYKEALADFKQVMALHKIGDFIFIYNQDSPLDNNEEFNNQVPYYDALYQQAQVKYFMDSLQSSYGDFQALVADNYEEKSNCVLWQGSIWQRTGKTDTACDFFNKAKSIALNQGDIDEANKMIANYCK